MIGGRYLIDLPSSAGYSGYHAPSDEDSSDNEDDAANDYHVNGSSDSLGLGHIQGKDKFKDDYCLDDAETLTDEEEEDDNNIPNFAMMDDGSPPPPRLGSISSVSTSSSVSSSSSTFLSPPHSPPPPPPPPRCRHSPSPSTRGGSVTFSTVTVRRIPPLSTYTMAEKRATWYTGTEFQTMRQHCVKVARKLEQKQQQQQRRSDTTTTTQETTVSSNSRPSSKLRGLERLTKTTVQKLLTRRKLLNSELQVLRQLGWKAGTTSSSSSPSNKHNWNAEEYLARLFQSYTAISAREARTMAKLDAKRAQQCYQQMDVQHELEKQEEKEKRRAQAERVATANAAAADAAGASHMNNRRRRRRSALSSSSSSSGSSSLPKASQGGMPSWTVESVFGEEIARLMENR